MISVGIDISNGKSTVCFLRPYGELVHRPFEIEHTEIGLLHLAGMISSLPDETKVVMEATGTYHLPVLNFLQQHSFFVSVINPLVMKRYANLTLRKGKTDPLDSIKIANYGIDNWTKLINFTASNEIYEELKILNRQYLSYLALRVNSKLTLVNLLDRTMPGIRTLLRTRSDVPDKDKLCAFASKYWHFDTIRKMSESRFADDYLKWVKKGGYKHSVKKAHEIYALALNSIPTLLSDTPSTKMLVLEAVKTLNNIDRSSALILSQMQKLAKTLKEYEVVMSMPGVGDVLGPRIIAEIGDIRRYRNASALIAYAGIDAPPFQSGAYCAARRNISKRGSPTLRMTGFQIMRMLKIIKPAEDNAVYQFILEKESEGKPKKVAKIAGLNKFLRIYYARVVTLYSE
jgi:transposase